MSRARWISDNAVRWGSRWARGEETDLEVGSNLRGRRVNVESIAATNDLGWRVLWIERETMVRLFNTLYLFLMCESV